MTEISKLAKLRLSLIATAAAAGIAAVPSLAAEMNVSEKEILDQAVALYEKLNGQEVEVPQALAEKCGEEYLGKAVILGFANADEIDSLSAAVSLRKQDAMTVLYKTIINFDDSFAMDSEEVEEIMNTCYDNAAIDEENRVGYAFMIKHGIIGGGTSTEPNKEISWKSCAVLVDLLYDTFVQETSFTVAGAEVKIGANIDTVTELIGEPDRIDESDYEFDWYIYNSDYDNFMMLGVANGRICAYFSNSGNFEFNGFKSGDDYLKTGTYADDKAYRFFADGDKLDALSYIPAERSLEAAQGNTSRAYELVDMVNAKRAKDNLAPLDAAEDMWHEANELAPLFESKKKAISSGPDKMQNGAYHASGYDICSVYGKLINGGSGVFDEKNSAVGVGISMTDNCTVTAAIITGDAKLGEKKYEIAKKDELTEVLPTKTQTPSPAPETKSVSDMIEAVSYNAAAVTLDTDAPTEMPATSPTALPEGSPVIKAPVNESVIDGGEDVVVELEKSVADEYYVQLYSVEEDLYIVNSNFKTSDNKIILSRELFKEGRDYVLTISAVSGEELLKSNDIIFTYGTVPSDAVKITSLEDNTVTDDDYAVVKWECDLYNDFIIDIYDKDGKLLITKPIIGEKEAEITNINPGEYTIRVSAVRRDTDDVIKAQSSKKLTVVLPEPVITEYILENGEKFYPVYSDDEMGIVYFYDEEIADIETVDGKGRTKTVQKKKITEKQVKATGYYRRLAAAQEKVEYFVGSNKLQLKNKPSMFNAIDNGKIEFAGEGSEMGNAIVREASKYLGVPYVWGGSTPAGFDCSGLVQYVCKSLGIEVDRVSQAQYHNGTPVSRAELQPGDLVFFSKNGDVHHVGIYVGNGMMIHAPYTGASVQYQSIDSGNYAKEFCGGRRVY